jgi:hypothetical protein
MPTVSPGKHCEVNVLCADLPHWPGHDDLGHWPLLERAWAYQERLLSPRVLHFCQDELVWECI